MSAPSLPRRRWPAVLCVLALALAVTPLDAQSLAPRAPYVVGPATAARLAEEAASPAGSGFGHRLTLKLVDAVRGRATSAGDLVSRVGADLAPVRALAARDGLAFRPLIALGEDVLASLERRAATRSSRAQPDLAGLLVVEVPGADVARLEQIGRDLAALPQVEYAFVETLGVPPPGDIAPATPNLTGHQAGYMGATSGMNVTAAWAGGLTGAGIRISDCEYGWNPAHEDLNDIDIHQEPGQTIHPSVYANGWDAHGTAVLGETSAVQNAYGITGMAHGAEVHTYTEWSVEQGFRRLTAITNAINQSDAGDVVLLEMQALAFGDNYGPAELDPNVHLVCKVGVQAGVVVVAAAGNGNQNLDSPTYATYMGWGDSGAIMVGAGSSNASHNKLSFSTYGSRVNVQGWGENVFTLGYGGFAQYGNDKNQQYTSTFSGTSSASPFVASACALLQQHAVAVHGAPLDPLVLRQVLVDTGRSQGSGGHIGPLPDLPAAMADITGGEFDPWTSLAEGGLAGLVGVPVQTPSGSLLPGTTFRFDLSNARGLAFAWQFVGVQRIDLPFKGGVMVPAPHLLLGPFVTLLDGTCAYTATWPGAPSGAEAWFQFWVQDAAGPAGFSATAGVQATTP